MRVIDPGHSYELDVYDSDHTSKPVSLRFMKREGAGYPRNVGTNSGTNCQEVLRVLINRVKYLDNQVPAPENLIILNSLRAALIAFETRAARRHNNRPLRMGFLPENERHCPVCGHMSDCYCTITHTKEEQ